jgi:dienelactone hydrolase/lysophospholipase L1-like esterase
MLLRFTGTATIVAGLVVAGLLHSTRVFAAEPLPKVVLLGDSIRMGYAPLVAKRLAGKAVVVSPRENGGTSANLLRNVERWCLREKPAVVHFNCGLHDLKLDKKTKQHQVELPQYKENLKELVVRLQKETTAALIFADTTPIIDARHAKRKATFNRFEADVQRYNAAALGVMKQCGVPVNDLHWVVTRQNVEQMLGPDGTHYTPAGCELLADAVADSVLRALGIAQFPVHPPEPASAEQAARYRKQQAERDAQVPPAFQKLPVPELRTPASAEAWRKERPQVLEAVKAALGDLPPRPSPQRVRLVTRELRCGYVVERVTIDNGVDSAVTALLLIPEKRQNPAPAVLWLHSSTPDKNQVLTPKTNGGDEPLGEVLVRAGYVVMASDAYWYGDRADLTPGGPAEAYRIGVPQTNLLSEYSLAKFNLWFGRTLWGMFVRDDQIALDCLCSRPEVDKKRIGATGMSMGSTRAWWLAAVDERIAATVAVACLTRYQNLIAHGELRAHGPYYFVYGLLKHFDTEGVVALIAPRPFLALTGDLDRGSPADGIEMIADRAGGVYGTLGAADRFKSVIYANTGHVYTPEMRAEMLAWFERWLQPSPRD